ncbi:MAG: hypothetical protein LBE71_00175 [Dysgonamonadaceae bacterium]|jgi:hypothetical protein|nr:hypothetical protein [Dysgonamonadaceae bacterium]
MNKKNLTIMLVAVICAPVLFSSCATIVTRSTYPVHINSNPQGANISIVDKHGREVYTGITPTSVKMKASAGFFSRAEYLVKFSKAGYADKTVFIDADIDGWYFGNILIGGLIGMLIIDPATGAMWKIDTEYLNETLVKTETSSDRELKIIDLADVPDHLKQHLVKIN